MIAIKKSYLLVLILAAYFLIVFPSLNKPFIGHHDWNGVWYSNIARNLLRYPLAETKLGSVINSGPTTPEGFAYFTHYPPLLPIFLAAFFFLFGQSEAIARTVPVIFTLFAAVMVYKIASIYFKPGVGLLSAAIYLVFPITIYFGKMPVQEVLVIGPVLLSVYLYFNFVKKQTKSNLKKLILSLIFSHLINWPGYYITPLFFMHYLIFKKGHNLKIALLFPLLSFLMFGIHSLYVAALTGNFLGGGLVDVLFFRLNLTGKLLDFSVFNFLNQQAHLLFIYYTRAVLLLASVAVFFVIKELKKKTLSLSSQILIILGVFGITHNAIFTNMAYIHDYMIIYLAPFLALSASTAFFQIIKAFKITKPVTILLAVILIGGIFLERRNYLQTLINSNSFYPGYIVGTQIRNHTQINDKSLILSDEFSRYFDVFVGYYSDREVFYGPKSPAELKEDIEENKYKMYVATPLRDTKIESIIELRKHFDETVIDDYFFYTPK